MKSVFAACMIFLAGAAHAEWVEIEIKYNDEKSYINTSNLRVVGSKRFYWTMASYEKPRLFNGKWNSSEVGQSVINCESLTMAFVYLSWYDGPNGTGQVTSYMNFPENLIEYHPIVPDSIGDIERKFVCKLPIKPNSD